MYRAPWLKWAVLSPKIAYFGLTLTFIHIEYIKRYIVKTVDKSRYYNLYSYMINPIP